MIQKTYLHTFLFNDISNTKVKALLAVFQTPKLQDKFSLINVNSADNHLYLLLCYKIKLEQYDNGSLHKNSNTLQIVCSNKLRDIIIYI